LKERMMSEMDLMPTGFWGEASWADPPIWRSKDRDTSLIDRTFPRLLYYSC
jgi:hypothetical protein